MTHLTDEQMYDLAVKVREDQAFTEEDLESTRHIGQCQSCYEALQRYLVTLEALEELRVPKKAELRLVFVDRKALLEQLLGSWCFEAPIALGANRGGASRKLCLEDVENSRSRVTYDPEEKRLTVCLARPARVWINDRELVLEKEGETWQGTAALPDSGEYRLVIREA